jgi:hypothetical protein
MQLRGGNDSTGYRSLVLPAGETAPKPAYNASMLIFVLFATRLRMRYEFLDGGKAGIEPATRGLAGFPWPDSEGASIASERRKDLENAKKIARIYISRIRSAAEPDIYCATPIE